MKKQILSEEFKRMQKLAGLITEEEANAESKEDLEQLKKKTFKLTQDPKLNDLAKKIMSGISSVDKEKLNKDLLNMFSESNISEENLNEDEYSIFSDLVDKQIEKINLTNMNESFYRQNILGFPSIPYNITSQEKEELLNKAKEILNIDKLKDNIEKYKKGEKVSLFPPEIGIMSLLGTIISFILTPGVGVKTILSLAVGAVVGLLVRQTVGPEKIDTWALKKNLKQIQNYEKDIDAAIEKSKAEKAKLSKPESQEDFNKRLYGF